MSVIKPPFVGILATVAALATASATVTVAPPYASNMVLQCGKPVAVTGTAAANKGITVAFNTQSKTTTSDTQGQWQVTLDPMTAKTLGGNLTVTETGANTVTLANVVVGDVWICSGQSNMAWNLGGCDRQADIDSANYPVMRQFTAPMANVGEPTKNITGSWAVCSPATASGFSAVAFYFGRKICQDQSSAIPIGLFVSSVGGTCIDPWLAPEGCTDIPVLAPLYSQSILPWGPFALFNGMIYPYAPLPAKGAIWYQGENRETTNQSTDSYFLKEKALQQGWKRLLGLDDFAFYAVQLANWLDPATTTAPDALGSWSDTRQMQEMVMHLAHGGLASAIDVGDAVDIHPKDKLDVGERLALWALKNDYGRSAIVPSGPVLKDVSAVNSTITYPARQSIVCSFDYVGSGLMVGSKTPYEATTEVMGGTLRKFVIAGATGSWYAADAVISGETVEVSSASVTTPTKVAYAYWTNPSGANLYNRNGLPALPFYVDDVTAKYNVTASADSGGTINPSGTATYLKRRTALYTITPGAGSFIKDVKVDGISVGSVNNYTFDPLYANHTITASFDAVAPSYTVTTSSTASGTVSPAGPVSVAQGAAQTFSMVPNAGCRLIATTVDGAPLGTRTRVTLADVRTAHALAAIFAVIPTPGTGTGLRGDYYIGMNFETFKITRSDANVNFDWGVGSPDAAIPVEGFTARWSGQIQPQFTETYQFHLNHDDGAKLWVNNQLLINHWTGAGTDDNGSISLTAGTKYDIKLEYVEASGNANCKLEWYSASLPREVVPQSQLFPATTPVYTLTATPGAHGSFSPGGAVLANSGGGQTFSITADVGYSVADVKVDNVSVGAVTSYVFTNVIANHAITATFAALPSYAVSGRVTDKTSSAALAGAKVNFYTSANFVGAASYIATTGPTGDYAINIPMGTWFMNATASNDFNSATRNLTVSNAPAGNINFALADGTRNIPRISDLLFSVVTESLPADGGITGWATYQPAGQTLSTIGTPAVETIMGRKWEKNLYADGDGLRLGNSYASAIACTGASIVLAVKPTRTPDSGNWRSLVDIFYDRLVLGITNDGGKVCVRRNGSVDFSNTSIPDGQLTILTLIVQTDGSYSVFANGGATALLSGAATGANSFIALTPGVTGGAGGYGSYINIGRNNPDGWSVSNGYIGDVFVYKTALSVAERQTIESDMLSKYITGGATDFTINATAGAGGTISPAGSTAVNSGASRTFNITANSGYAISGVTVDDGSVGVVSSYTFSGVTANHAISATFSGGGSTYTITATAGTGGSISPSGTVSVNSGANQDFTITPNSGYTISGVTVDGGSVGAVASYPFTNITANHTIAATFTGGGATYTITATAGAGGSISPSGSVSVNSGANQDFTITPDSGHTISGVTVDGGSVGALASYPFTNVTANHTIAASFATSVNTPPTITTVADQNITADTTTAALAFTVGDSSTPPSGLTITAASSNTTLVPNINVVIGGSAANRTVQVTPAAKQTGTATITLTVSDGVLTASSSFRVTVTAAATGGAKSISINVGYNGLLVPSDSAGVVSVANWNELSGSNNPSSSSLLDEAGASIPGLTVSFQGNGNTFNNTGVPSRTMLSGFLSGNPMSCQFTNIPFASYDVYVYYAGFSSNHSLTWVATDTGASTVLDTQYSVRGTLSGPQLFPTPGLAQSNYSTLAAADAQAALGNGGNWLKFTGLTATHLKIAETSSNGGNENGFSGIQIVNTAPVNTYASWISGYPGVGSATAFNDDPDGDGVKNGLENYLGTDPSKSSAGLADVVATGSGFKFRHTRSNTAASDIAAGYQWSADLTHWYDSGASNGAGISASIAAALITDANAPDNDLVEVTVTVANGGAARVFARIRATH